MDKKKELIIINKSEISSFKQEAGKMLFNKGAEDQLLALLKIKDEIDQAIDEVKKNILIAGHSITQDFKGVVGRNVKCVVRQYGDRYRTTNPEYQKQIVIRRADSDKIEEYVNNKGKLPEGVVENEREEKLTIIIPNKDDTTIGKLE